MERMPTEMWMLIFENLETCDTKNVYRTCKIWEDILKPARSLWMLELVLPSILEYLSKTDILNCRAVCKKWGSGVDNVLVNNPHIRPAVEDCPVQNGVYKTDFCDDSLCKLYFKATFYESYWGNIAKRHEMLKNAEHHSGCPIVGKSMVIFEPIPPRILSNIKFLEVVGRHIWFLRLSIESPPTQSLKRILEILSLVPNIKTLQVSGTAEFGLEDKRELENILQEYSTNRNEVFPKIETLKVFSASASFCYLMQYLLCCIAPDKLQSLQTRLSVQFSLNKFNNLVDLNLAIYSDLEFEKLMELNSPIRRLTLELCRHVDSSRFFGILKHFCSTLRNFELYLSPDYYIDSKFPMETFSKRVESFACREILADMKQLKRVTLKDCLPPSLNFLLGVSKSLEYLHLPLHTFDGPDNEVEVMIESLPFVEIIDVMHKTKVQSCGDQLPVTYDSNVWSLFPKLKFLSMCWNMRDIGNRREAYEKFKNSLLD